MTVEIRRPEQLQPGFPRWQYFPSNARPPEWVRDLVAVIADEHNRISTAGGAGLSSNAVLDLLNPGLSKIGFTVESSKRTVDKISRPVLFGGEGKPSVTYEIDAFHDGAGVALEVEAGRAWNGNAVYRDLVRTSLLLEMRGTSPSRSPWVMRRDRPRCPCLHTTTRCGCCKRSTRASGYGCHSTACC